MVFNKSLVTGLITSRFPTVVSAWAYGSAVFPQSTSSNPSNLIDLFLIVDDPHKFHTQNMRLHPTHYSGLSSLLGPTFIQVMNRVIFPIHFNSHITLEGVKLKYAIVEQAAFKQDLTTWNYLTMAGRLQKPVRFLLGREKYVKQLEMNLVSALGYGFLKAESGPEEGLYQGICKLSYVGDVRYSVSLENKNKVQNIVRHNLENFKRLYHPIIEKHFKDHVRIENGMVQISKDQRNIQHYLQKSIIKGQESVQDLTRRIQVINRSSSIRMAAYNFFSSSVRKNLVYLMEKARKSKHK